MADWIDESQEQQIKMLQEQIAQAISAPRRAALQPTFVKTAKWRYPNPGVKLFPAFSVVLNVRN